MNKRLEEVWQEMTCTVYLTEEDMIFSFQCRDEDPWYPYNNFVVEQELTKEEYETFEWLCNFFKIEHCHRDDDMLYLLLKELIGFNCPLRKKLIAVWDKYFQ